jgi:hypothetical protein
MADLKRQIYNLLPSFAQDTAKTAFNNYKHGEFVGDFFDSDGEYRSYRDEIYSPVVRDDLEEANRRYQKASGDALSARLDYDAVLDYYALVRKLRPQVVVETGVCHGVSTLFVLLALQQNESGQLYSIDFPFRADDSLEEFREKTFAGYGGAAIPADKDPGWILPSSVKSRWELILGKSQRELPKLLPQLSRFGLFIHDSEHSHPCMMLEFELAYEWLDEGGVALSDDISWNEAFQTFTDVRAPNRHGLLSTNVGYFVKE